MELSQRSSNSSRGGRNRWEVAGWANWATTLNHEAWDGLIPKVSKLRGLPAHLPRNLASFSPRVDDGDSGGSGPRWLCNHRWFLPYRRRGIRVLIERFNRRGQRSYWRTVLQGERGAVHRLAFGWSSALRVGHGVGAVDAAAKTGAQLQAPHVADHSGRIKGLPPFAFGKVFPDLPTDGFMYVLAESGVSSDPGVLKSLITCEPLLWVLLN